MNSELLAFGHLWFAAILCLAPASSALQAQSGSPLEEAGVALEQFEQLYQARRFREALELARRAVQLRETALGPDHVDTAAALISWLEPAIN